jgi:integrase/recombinase XerD
MANYARSIATVALHFGTDPIDLSIEQINDYLYSMLKQVSSPSKSYFRHTVYGLKCLFKMMGKLEKALKMPRAPPAKPMLPGEQTLEAAI